MISELAEDIDADLLADAARTAPVPWIQRPGHLLELAEAGHLAGALKGYVRNRARDCALPAPSGDSTGKRITDWRLIVNESVEPGF